VAAFRAIDASGFARCDFFLEAATGRVVLNEINTIPGMTAMSGFPRLWEASGVGGRQLIEEIVRLGLERHERLARLKMAR
jgi:D-alanine-D-alanine ligase